MPRFQASIEAELGHPGLGSGPGPTSVTGATWVDEWEETPELRWPQSVVVFDRMRRTDAQTRAVHLAVTLPMRRATWAVGRDGVDPRVADAVELNFGLVPERRGQARRRRQGISWDDYLRHLFLDLVFGHMPFEQVYDVGPPPPALEGRNLPNPMASLRKLGPRMPRSLTGIDVARDGGLEAVRQLVIPPGEMVPRERRLEVDRLVYHCNEREGAEWRGQSLYRSSYKHWLIADALHRIGPMAVERNGMGLPVVTYDPAMGGTRAMALAIARDFRAGDQAALAVPEGYTVQLLGVQGAVRDELPLLRYHQEANGRNALAMFLNLGHDRGARSLGDTYVDFFTLSLNALSAQEEETITEYAVRDFVVKNFGEDEPYPPVLCEEITPDQVLNPTDLAALVAAEVIIPDAEFRADVRRRYGYPVEEPTEVPDWSPWEGVVDVPAPDGTTPPPGPPAGPPAAPAPPPPLPAPRGLPAPAAAAGLDTAGLERRRAELVRRIEARREARAAAIDQARRRADRAGVA